jgi:hypothetical protein
MNETGQDSWYYVDWAAQRDVVAVATIYGVLLYRLSTGEALATSWIDASGIEWYGNRLALAGRDGVVRVWEVAEAGREPNL